LRHQLDTRTLLALEVVRARARLEDPDPQGMRPLLPRDQSGGYRIVEGFERTRAGGAPQRATANRSVANVDRRGCDAVGTVHEPVPAGVGRVPADDDRGVDIGYACLVAADGYEASAAHRYGPCRDVVTSGEGVAQRGDRSSVRVL